jgi:hypothetical protein
VLNRSRQGVTERSLVLAAGICLIACALPALATAATAPTPVSATNCSGALTKAPTADEPNLLGYKFHCDWGISAYTLVVNRKPNDYNTLDDFSPTADVIDLAGNVVSTLGLTCDGSIPGNGVSCNPGAKKYLAAPDYAQGTIDTSDPYCANIPADSPPGTRAEPQAIVQLVVTDTTGAQDGPFRLNLGSSCGPTPKPHLKANKKHRHKQQRARRKKG